MWLLCVSCCELLCDKCDKCMLVEVALERSPSEISSSLWQVAVCVLTAIIHEGTIRVFGEWWFKHLVNGDSKFESKQIRRLKFEL